MLDNLIMSVYSVEIGLSEEDGEALYFRSLQDPIFRKKISAEIDVAFADEDFSWADFLEENEVYEADNEEDARNYAEKIILAPLVRYVNN